MQVEFVKDLDIFLEKAEYGINHTYQLHSELGGVFIEASFQASHEEEREIQPLYKTRIEVSPPKFISSSLRWDSNGFPYELEIYSIGDKELIVPFYRPLEVGWRSFLLDVAAELRDLILDEKLTNADFVVPTSLVEGMRKVAKNIQEITTFLTEKKSGLDDKEQLAIDRHFGECGIWERLEEGIEPALATYLGSAIFAQRETYEKIQQEKATQRREAFVVMDNELIKLLEDKLKQHKFKKGYVS